MSRDVLRDLGASNLMLLRGLDASDPMGFMAACGLLRVVARTVDDARLSWIQEGAWLAQLHVPEGVDPIDQVMADLERWRRNPHKAVDFAARAEHEMQDLGSQIRKLKKRKRELSDEQKEQLDALKSQFDRCRKVQDLKHPPEDFRAFMRELTLDGEGSAFVAAYATGVARDGRGQTKPTSFHFTAGQQRFMDAVLNLREEVTREDVVEALESPWVGRKGPKDLRWRAASERYRALLSFDPSKDSATTVTGAAWLAYQALPLFPCVPVGLRVETTGFTGRGKHEYFAWPVWSTPLSVDSVRVLVGTKGLVESDAQWRHARGVAQVFETAVVRSSQGYGNFAAASPVVTKASTLA